MPGGFGVRGTEGKMLAINWARKKNKPYLGKTITNVNLQSHLFIVLANQMKHVNVTEWVMKIMACVVCPNLLHFFRYYRFICKDLSSR